jgi:hypothetical protein
MKEVHGGCVGIKFEQRGKEDKHICIRLQVEDDEIWHDKDFSISSFWLDDLIKVATEAKKILESTAIKDQSGFGYCFKE